MTADSPSSDLTERAMALYASLVDSDDSVDPTEVQRLCEEYPELAPEIRRLDGDWVRVRSLFGSRDSGRVVVVDIDSTAPLQLLRRIRGRRSTAARYNVGQELGRGGMGIVLEAWDKDLDRPLAMKTLRERDSDSEFLAARRLARFLEEAQVTAQLDHPGIPPVHEIGIDAEGRVFFTMKVIEGLTFVDVIQDVRRGDHPSWTLPRAIGVLQRVCEAMAYAHSRGVIHRDLKPSNVMVGKFGEVYVMDWGLARVLASEVSSKDDSEPRTGVRRGVASVRSKERGEGLASPMNTMEGDVVGTPAYMSPEQAAGSLDAATIASDVYSIGAMLYELLVGRPPHSESEDQSEPRDTLERVRTTGLAPVRKLAPNAPAKLAAICEKATERHADQRYAGVAELGSELLAYLEGRIVQAHRTGPLAKLENWVRRKPALASSLGLTALVAVLGVLALQDFRREARAQEERKWRSQLRAAEVLLVTNSAGASAREVGQRRQAVELLLECTELRPEHPIAWLRLCEAWRRLGESEKARIALQAAVALGEDGWVAQTLEMDLNGGPRLMTPQASQREAWKNWRPHDQFGLAHTHMFLGRPADAAEILWNPNLRRDPLLVTDLLLAIVLHQDLVSGQEGRGHLFSNPDTQIRVILDFYDSMLRQLPNDPLVGFNRSVFISDVVKPGQDLGRDVEALWDEAAAYFADQILDGSNPHAEDEWIKFMVTHWKVWRDRDSLETAVDRFAKRPIEELIAPPDNTNYVAKVESLVCVRNYELALDLLERRNFEFVDVQRGPMHMLLLIHSMYLNAGYIDPDIEGLTELLSKYKDQLGADDLRAATDLGVELGMTLESIDD